MKLTALLALIALIIGFTTSRMIGPPKPKPPKPKAPDDFDVLLDEYMIYDPDLDGKI
jgi:hypothetical protein